MNLLGDFLQSLDVINNNECFYHTTFGQWMHIKSSDFSLDINDQNRNELKIKISIKIQILSLNFKVHLFLNNLE